MSNLGASYRHARKLKQALALHEEAFQRCKARLGADDPYTLFSMSNLAFTYAAAGRLEKALSLREETLTRRKARLGAGHPDTIQTMSDLAGDYSKVGKLEQALPLYQQAAAGVEKLEFAHENAGRIIHGLYGCHEQLKEYDRAEVWRRKWLAVVKGTEGPESAPYTWELAGLGANLLRQKKYAGAEPVLRECLTIFQRKRPEGWKTFHVQSLLGTALLGQKNYEEAEPLLRGGYQGMKTTLGRSSGPAGMKVQIEALERLAQIYDARNKPEEASRWRKELEEVKAATKTSTRLDK
jgi:tetratricopeptide (TPR) repeat protein